MYLTLLFKPGRSWFIRLSHLSLLAAFLCLSLSDSAFATDTSHQLDGRSYVGKNGVAGQQLAEYEDEEIVFKNGMFTSVSCKPYNFTSSPYTAKNIAGKTHFTAVTKSPSHGTITWQGIIDGDEASVTFVWTKKRWYWDTRREYWFRGKLKQ